MDPNQQVQPGQMNTAAATSKSVATPMQGQQPGITTAQGEKKSLLNKKMLILLGIILLIIIIGTGAFYIMSQKQVSDKTNNTSLQKAQQTTDTLNTLENEAKSDQGDDINKEFTAVDQEAQSL